MWGQRAQSTHRHIVTSSRIIVPDARPIGPIWCTTRIQQRLANIPPSTTARRRRTIASIPRFKLTRIRVFKFVFVCECDATMRTISDVNFLCFHSSFASCDREQVDCYSVISIVMCKRTYTLAHTIHMLCCGNRSVAHNAEQKRMRPDKDVRKFPPLP